MPSPLTRKARDELICMTCHNYLGKSGATPSTPCPRMFCTSTWTRSKRPASTTSAPPPGSVSRLLTILCGPTTLFSPRTLTPWRTPQICTNESWAMWRPTPVAAQGGVARQASRHRNVHGNNRRKRIDTSNVGSHQVGDRHRLR